MSTTQPRAITLYSMKGGVGTTTTAVALAHEAAEAGLRVLIIDAATGHDVAAVAGSQEPKPLSIHQLDDNLSMVTVLELARIGAFINDPNYDLLVIDTGHVRLAGEKFQAIQVLTNSYLSLRRAVADKNDDEIISIINPAGALIAKDVNHCVGRTPIVQIDHKPEIARAVDAGLLPCRRAQLFPSFAPILNPAATAEATV